jgi:hypothetical protein
MENSMEASQKTQNRAQYDPVISCLGILPKEMRLCDKGMPTLPCLLDGMNEENVAYLHNGGITSYENE